MQAWIDGRLVPWEQATVPILSHAFSRGLAVFEVLGILDTPRGPAFFCLDAHIDRFFRSAEALYLDLPLTREALARAVRETAVVNGVRFGVGKFYAFSESVEFGPALKDPRISVAVFCAGHDRFGFDPDRSMRPVTVGLSQIRKLHPATVPLQAKVTGNYVGGYLATREVTARGFDYALMCDTDGYVADGASQSAFFVRDGAIVTPPLSRVLAGTTRKVILDVAADAGIAVREQDILPGELEGFDEAFLTGSVVRVLPVSSIDGRSLGGQCPGPVTREIMERMSAVYEGRDERYFKFLTWIGGEGV